MNNLDLVNELVSKNLNIFNYQNNVTIFHIVNIKSKQIEYINMEMEIKFAA